MSVLHTNLGSEDVLKAEQFMARSARFVLPSVVSGFHSYVHNLARHVMSGCSAACPASHCTGGWCNREPGHGGPHCCGTCGHNWF